MQITEILKRFGLLDHEEYLVPPEHPNVTKMIQRLVKMRSIVEDGKVLTPQQKADLRDLEAAKDYYDEALDEELELHNEQDDEEEVDDEAEDDDEEEEGEPESASPVEEPVKTRSKITLQELVEDDVDDDEEDETYED